VVAVQGYDTAIVREITASRFAVRDPAYQEIRADADRPWRCWWDLEFDYGATRLGRDLLVPAGFRGGVSLRLETRHGRHVGDLHMSTERRRYPSPGAMRALHRMRHVLAQLCLTADPAVDVGGAEHAAVRIWPDGEVDSLRAGPEPHLSIALREMALRNVDIAMSATPARVRRWRAPDGTWHRAVFHGSPRAAVVQARPEPIPFGLTPRELEVLGLLTEGLANFSISRRLDLSERTVAHGVERILKKLDAESRAGAAATAEREGLIVVR
jgi:DNA-binding CsgD family transcriptional regulator